MEPLTKAAFAPYGEVLQGEGAERRLINEGTTDRLHALATADVSDRDGVAIVSIFHTRRRQMPLEIAMLERHPLGSQTFFPLQPFDWLVVVCADGPAPPWSSLRCFLVRGTQGVNYHKNVWHHPLLVLEKEQDFLVIDRAGAGANLEEISFPDHAVTIDLGITSARDRPSLR